MYDNSENYLMLYSVIGALAGLGLSFTALSPLAVGGIVGSMVPACWAVFYIVGSLYKFFKKILLKKLCLSVGVLQHP